MGNLNGLTFLVTGANSGIGLSTVKGIAAEGGNVILACRSRSRTEPVIAELRRQFPDVQLSFLEVDMGDLQSVKNAAATFLDAGTPLDVLVNNAGIAGVPGLTKDGFEITVGTNHLGPFLFTELLLPRLRSAPRARVVNVASRAHMRVKEIKWGALREPLGSTGDRLKMYGVSKLMNVVHAVELARRLSGTNVTTYSLHPGVVASNVWRSVPWPIQPLIKIFMLSNDEGARTSLYCATSAETASQSGRYYDNSREAAMNPFAQDESLAGELFRWSQEAAGAFLR